MANVRVMALAFMAFLLPLASEAARVQKETATCSRDQVFAKPEAECDSMCLQEHFDGFREEYDIVDDEDEEDEAESAEPTSDASKCTMQDVCLLMRQLDMDFVRRARLGEVTDAEAETSLTQGWVHAGNCYSQASARGFRMEPVRSQEMCKKALAKKGVKPAKKFVVQWKSYPAGCIEVDKNGRKLGRLNDVETMVDAGIKFKGGRKSASGADYGRGRKRIETVQFCEQDRKLDEAAALYYSPYKIDHSMVKRTEFSTSCSFGMMAHLANTGATQSPCAKILAYRPPAEFQALQAQDALDKASKLEGADAAGAAALRAYAEAMREKNTLIEIVANQWCGGVWNSALQSQDSTCALPRSPEFAKKEPGQPAAMWREPKRVLTEEACAASAGGETLADILENVSETPPDFFRDADV